MKKTIYLTESDIRKMVYETILELDMYDNINEGKFGGVKAAIGALGTLGVLAAGGNYVKNHPSNVNYPQSVFYDVEQQKADNNDSLNYADYMEQQYGKQGISKVEKLTGESMPNPVKKTISRPSVEKNTISRNTIARNTIARNKYYTPSQKLIDYIKSYETLHEGWKDDGYGNPTTGWGTKQTPELLRKYPKGVYTPEEADVLLYDYINESINEFVSLTPNIQMLPQEVKDALYDCYYNIGATKYKNSNGLMAALQNYKVTKDKKAIINNLRFAKANGKVSPGLQRRSTDRQQMAANKDYTRGEDRYFKWN